MKKQLKEIVSIVHSEGRQIAGESRPIARMRLADFIHENTEYIVSEWETFAETLTPAANDMSPRALRNHIHPILAFIVSDIESLQTDAEQMKKSQGKKKKTHPTAAETHAAIRLAGGFEIDQMVSEFRALRASVIKLWGKANAIMDSADMMDLTRFNESIDQELAESVSIYTQKVNYSRDMFIGILSHDLRNPLNAISMCSQLMLNIGSPHERQTLNERQIMLATQIYESTSRITEIVSNLLDVTRSRFGAGLSVIRAPMDMAFASRQLVDEMRAAYPLRTITLEVAGDLKGKWDKARMGQVFSNLIGNAIQYSFKDSSVHVVVKGALEEIILSVHNEGIPIAAEKIGSIFNSLTRATIGNGDEMGTVNLGLGLYITREIVVSHGGSIDIVSTEDNGTTVTARIPRLAYGGLFNLA